jgi:hypothetical protein
LRGGQAAGIVTDTALLVPAPKSFVARTVNLWTPGASPATRTFPVKEFDVQLPDHTCLPLCSRAQVVATDGSVPPRNATVAVFAGPGEIWLIAGAGSHPPPALDVALTAGPASRAPLDGARVTARTVTVNGPWQRSRLTVPADVPVVVRVCPTPFAELIVTS